MELGDIDRKRRFITVRLNGARDEHRVPVTDDFWPIYEEYLHAERRAAPDVNAVWIASRKGQGKPLRYASFESILRYIGRRAGISVHPHSSVTRSPKACSKPPATSRSRKRFSGIHI